MKTIAALKMVQLLSMHIPRHYLQYREWKLVTCAGAIMFMIIFVLIWLKDRGVLFSLRWPNSSPFEIN